MDKKNSFVRERSALNCELCSWKTACYEREGKSDMYHRARNIHCKFMPRRIGIMQTGYLINAYKSARYIKPATRLAVLLRIKTVSRDQTERT